MSTLYRLDFLSGKSYIGITTRRLGRRIKAHLFAANNGRNWLVSRAWRKHGAPTVVTLAIVESHMLLDAEKRAIAAFGTMVPGGYNMTPGGEISPFSVPGVALRAAAPRRGKKLSEEHKRKISDACNKNPNPATRPEVRAKISAALRGRVISPEWRAKLADSLRGKNLSAAHLAKLNGRKLSDSHKKNISKSLLGHKCSQETKEKISASNAMNRPEVAAKVSLSKRGNRNPMRRPEVAAKQSASLKKFYAEKKEREPFRRLLA